MRRIRLYCDPANLSLRSGYVGELDSRNLHYLKNVLRVRSGQVLALFDGRGQEFEASVTAVNRRDIEISIGKTVNREQSSESPLNIQLAIGISKGERMDWVMQKATELGVTSIQPLFSERCDVKLDATRLNKKLDHWKSVIVSACEQSDRVSLPNIHEPIDLKDYLNRKEVQAADLRLVFHPGGQSLSQIAKSHKAPESVVMVIGPEGGFEDSEAAGAANRGFLITGLGARILRTETAPVAALAIAQYSWGDL